MSLYDKDIDVAGWVKKSKEIIDANKEEILEKAKKEIIKAEKRAVLDTFNYIYPQMVGEVYCVPNVFIRKNHEGLLEGKMFDYYFYSKLDCPSEVRFCKISEKKGFPTTEPVLLMNVSLLVDSFDASVSKDKKIRKTHDRETKRIEIGSFDLSVEDYYYAYEKNLSSRVAALMGINERKVDKLIKDTIFGKIDEKIENYKTTRKLKK